MLSPNGDTAAGQVHWNALCVDCHGQPNGGYITNGIFKINAMELASYDSSAGHNGYPGLQYYIHAEMPKGMNSVLCENDCAEDVAAYIRSWADTVSTTACDSSDPVTYGTRALMLLSSTQYQKSVEDLLGVTANFGANVANNDGVIGGFPSMANRAVSTQVADFYAENAETIAAWAVTNSKPFVCSDATLCATRFVDEFAYRAFRRPLTDDEKSAYRALFTQYGATEGMELALTAVLSSPQFLYRSEVGVDIATAMLAGYYSNSGGDSGANYVSDGQRTTVRALDFSALGSVGGPEGEGDQATLLGYNIWSDGTIGHSFANGLYDVTIVEIEAKGTPYDDTWPEMTVAVGGQVIGTVSVNNNTYSTYSFTVTGKASAQTVEISFAGDQGRTPYDVYGNDKNLLINSASISRGIIADQAPPPVNPLELADADAYVLTPYEFAAALSYKFTGSTPDMALLEAAGKDQLTTPAQVEAQVQRLINSDRGREHFGDFAGLWFRTDAVTRANRDAVTGFTSAVKQSMAQEVKELFKYVFYNDDVPFSELYSGDFTLLNKTLADFYGISGQFGESFIRADTTTRGGIITTGAFMAVNAHNERTSPIKRAVRVRELMLCHHIDPPNAELDGDRAAAQMMVEAYEAQNGGISSREFYRLYTEDAACAGCHQTIINPMFGMEDFDNVGRLRAPAGDGAVYEVVSNGREMEVSLEGALYGVNSTKDPTIINYVGAKDLSKKIANTDAVKSCLVRKGFRFVTGLPAGAEDTDSSIKETLTADQLEDYACATSEMKNALMSSGESPKAMFGKLGTLDLLRFRK